MSEMKYLYFITQGIMSKSGTGDTFTFAKTKSFKEAKRIFNEIKEDLGNEILYKGHYLETSIEKHYVDDNNEIIDEDDEINPDFIIKRYEYRGR